MTTTDEQVKLPPRPGHEPHPAEPGTSMTAAARCSCHASWEATYDGPPFAEWALTHQHPRQAEANEAADALSELAAFIRTNPDFAPAIDGLNPMVTPGWLVGDRAVEFGRLARLLGGTRTKDADDNWMRVTRKFGPISLEVFVDRARVCERVVVGTETVEVPDPDAPKVTVEREVVRWECKPILDTEAE